MAESTTLAGEAQTRSNAAALFWRYWTGSTISQVGDAVTSVGVPLIAVITLRASAIEVGLVTGAGDLAWTLIGLPAGVIVGRLPLKATQVAMDLIRAGAVASVPIAYGFHVLTLAQLFLVALIVGFASVLFSVGNSTFLTSVVSKEDLTKRNSLSSASDAATMLGGPALGGVLVQLVGAASSLVVDAVSYLCSAVILSSLPRPSTLTERKPGVSAWWQIREGLGFVLRHRVMAPCVAASTVVCVFSGAMSTLTPLFLVRTLGEPASVVGLVVATDGAGALLGAAITPWLARRWGTAQAVFRATVFTFGCALIMPLAGHEWGVLVFAVGNIGVGIGVLVLSILTRTHRQTVSPNDVLPRVMGTVRFLTWGPIPIGAVVAGAAAGPLGIRTVMWVASALTVCAPLVLWLRGVARMRDLIEDEASA